MTSSSLLTPAVSPPHAGTAGGRASPDGAPRAPLAVRLGGRLSPAPAPPRP